MLSRLLYSGSIILFSLYLPSCQRNSAPAVQFFEDKIIVSAGHDTETISIKADQHKRVRIVKANQILSDNSRGYFVLPAAIQSEPQVCDPPQVVKEGVTMSYCHGPESMDLLAFGAPGLKVLQEIAQAEGKIIILNGASILGRVMSSQIAVGFGVGGGDLKIGPGGMVVESVSSAP